MVRVVVSYEIVGIGGPILDQILPVSEKFIQSIHGDKGGMLPVDLETLEQLIDDSGNTPEIVAGGSARNTLHGLARFGEKTALLGMVGRDARGKLFRSLLDKHDIHPLLIESNTPTATVLSMVTPDGERTMRTLQGASIEIRGPDVAPAIFEGVRMVHFEGYALFNEEYIEEMMHLAKEAGAKISLDLASFEIAERFKETILHLLKKYVDIVFANEEEGVALTSCNRESACDFLSELCEISVLLMGPKGCYVKQGQLRVRCPAYPVQPLDTTGAGDLFASGFLHGVMRDFPIDICAHYGAIAGRAVVQVKGAVISHDHWEELFAQLKHDL